LGLTPVVALLEDFITRILAEQQEDKRRRVSGMIWGIWFNMNEAVWKQNVMTVDQLVHHVDEFMHCWLGVWTIHSTQLVSRAMVEGGDLNSLHLDDVIMETDSQHLWQAFHNGYEDAFDLGDANKVTHVLARGALLRVNYMDCTICPFSIARIVNAEKLSNLYVNEGS
ncbi:hypothetical protein Goarm_002016, partial [Gossypium armourianum]|nr:hypothetical protein [Gossypium armourianum]